jgi:hypothetical protein
VHDDTHPLIQRKLDDHYRGLEPWQRIEIVRMLGRRTDGLAMVGLQERHPSDDLNQLRLRLAALKHGRDLIARAFGIPLESLAP